MSFFMQNIEFFIFVAFLVIFLIIKRKRVEIQGSFPILYMMLYKTTLGLDKMKSWSQKYPKTFLYLSYYAIFVGVIGMIAMIFLMVWQLGFIIDNNLSSGGGFVLPIQTEGGMESAVPVFYVPFWYWLVALAILATVHEFAHGVIAQRFKVKIKSSGFAFLGIIAPILPAAFVEPDQKQMAKKPKWQQISILGAGSASNFIFGFIFLLLWILVAGPLVNNTQDLSGISFGSTMNQSSLHSQNVTSGIIVDFNGYTNSQDILNNFGNLSTNNTYNLTINSSGEINTYQIQPFQDNISGRALIGLSNLDVKLEPKENFKWLGSIPTELERMLFWIWILNIGIGMMNLLPIWITDGGQISRILFSYKFSEKTSIRLTHILSIISLILIIFTVKPSLLISLLSIF